MSLGNSCAPPSPPRPQASYGNGIFADTTRHSREVTLEWVALIQHGASVICSFERRRDRGLPSAGLLPSLCSHQVLRGEMVDEQQDTAQNRYRE